MPTTTRSSPQRRAADLAARDRAVMQEIQKEQKVRDEKTARLRALRLAKEAADKAVSDKAEAEQLRAAEKALKPSSPAKKPARRRQKSKTEDNAAAEQATQHG